MWPLFLVPSHTKTEESGAGTYRRGRSRPSNERQFLRRETIRHAISSQPQLESLETAMSSPCTLSNTTTSTPCPGHDPPARSSDGELRG